MRPQHKGLEIVMRHFGEKEKKKNMKGKIRGERGRKKKGREKRRGNKGDSEQELKKLVTWKPLVSQKT